MACIIPRQIKEIPKETKSFKNISVREYARVDDKIVYQPTKSKLGDFEAFKREILRYTETT